MASPLLVHPSGEGRDIVHVRPDGREWKYIDFRAVRLEPGQTIHDRTGSDEVIAVVIAGSIDVECGATSWSRVGRREDPFSGAPASVYFPADCKYALRALTSCEVAICAAPARGPGRPPRLLPCGDGYVRGEGHAQRTIYNVMMDEGGASTLFVTEVITKAGNWSSYPPHKHDEDNPPLESQLEELYYYRAQPAAGFAFQRIYTAAGDLDETVTAHDRDVVLVPRGYHVCAAAAEYTIYYLNVLAGPKHVYRMTFDPAHAWIKEGWKW